MQVWKNMADAYKGYGQYLWHEITHPSWHNYFYWLIGISLMVFALECLRPWRPDQPRFRKDFWLDSFYMFFNFFLFSLLGFAAFSKMTAEGLRHFLNGIGVDHLVAVEIHSWPVWLQLLTLFVVRDFIHFNVHRLLHRVPILWEFHKVHHSVREMGFAAHLRYHWMENVVYRSLEYIPLAMIGFGIRDFILVHLIALTIGHLNHANFYLPLGPFRYLFNNPQMHIWHHAHQLPKTHRYGINFGISLSIWDYLFGTAHQPHSGRDLELGFDGVDTFPKTFLKQSIYPLGQSNREPGMKAEVTS